MINERRQQLRASETLATVRALPPGDDRQGVSAMATIYESCGCSEGDITIGFTKKFGMCPLHAAAPALCKVVREAALLCMLISDGVNPHSWHAAQIYGRARAALALVDTTSRIG